MKYRLRSYYVTGYFVYNKPTPASYSRNYIDVDWMDVETKRDQTTLKQDYPGDHWRTASSFREIEENISDGNYPLQTTIPDKVKKMSYISNLTLDDLSVYNQTTRRWENLYDTTPIVTGKQIGRAHV